MSWTWRGRHTGVTVALLHLVVTVLASTAASGSSTCEAITETLSALSVHGTPFNPLSPSTNGTVNPSPRCSTVGLHLLECDSASGSMSLNLSHMGFEGVFNMSSWAPTSLFTVNATGNQLSGVVPPPTPTLLDTIDLTANPLPCPYSEDLVCALSTNPHWVVDPCSVWNTTTADLYGSLHSVSLPDDHWTGVGAHIRFKSYRYGHYLKSNESRRPDGYRLYWGQPERTSICPSSPHVDLEYSYRDGPDGEGVWTTDVADLIPDTPIAFQVLAVYHTHDDDPSNINMVNLCSSSYSVGNCLQSVRMALMPDGSPQTAPVCQPELVSATRLELNFLHDPDVVDGGFPLTGIRVEVLLGELSSSNPKSLGVSTLGVPLNNTPVHYEFDGLSPDTPFHVLSSYVNERGVGDSYAFSQPRTCEKQELARRWPLSSGTPPAWSPEVGCQVCPVLIGCDGSETCANGHDGPLCAGCEDGYFTVGVAGACRPCRYHLISLSVQAVLLVTGIIVARRRKPSLMWAMIFILVNTTQVFQVLLAANPHWIEFSVAFSVWTDLLMPLSLTFPLKCYTGSNSVVGLTSFQARIVTIVATLPLLLAACLLVSRQLIKSFVNKSISSSTAPDGAPLGAKHRAPTSPEGAGGTVEGPPTTRSTTSNKSRSSSITTHRQSASLVFLVSEDANRIPRRVRIATIVHRITVGLLLLGIVGLVTTCVQPFLCFNHDVITADGSIMSMSLMLYDPQSECGTAAHFRLKLLGSVVVAVVALVLAYVWVRILQLQRQSVLHSYVNSIAYGTLTWMLAWDQKAFAALILVRKAAAALSVHALVQQPDYILYAPMAMNLVMLVLLRRRRPYLPIYRRLPCVRKPVDVLNTMDSVNASLLLLASVSMAVICAIPSVRHLTFMAGAALFVVAVVLGVGLLVWVYVTDKRSDRATFNVTATGVALEKEIGRARSLMADAVLVERAFDTAQEYKLQLDVLVRRKYSVMMAIHDAKSSVAPLMTSLTKVDRRSSVAITTDSETDSDGDDGGGRGGSIRSRVGPLKVAPAPQSGRLFQNFQPSHDRLAEARSRLAVGSMASVASDMEVQAAVTVEGSILRCQRAVRTGVEAKWRARLVSPQDPATAAPLSQDIFHADVDIVIAATEKKLMSTLRTAVELESFGPLMTGSKALTSSAALTVEAMIGMMESTMTQAEAGLHGALLLLKSGEDAARHLADVGRRVETMVVLLQGEADVMAEAKRVMPEVAKQLERLRHKAAEADSGSVCLSILRKTVALAVKVGLGEQQGSGASMQSIKTAKQAALTALTSAEAVPFGHLEAEAWKAALGTTSALLRAVATNAGLTNAGERFDSYCRAFTAKVKRRHQKRRTWCFRAAVGLVAVAVAALAVGLVVGMTGGDGNDGGGAQPRCSLLTGEDSHICPMLPQPQWLGPGSHKEQLGDTLLADGILQSFLAVELTLGRDLDLEQCSVQMLHPICQAVHPYCDANCAPVKPCRSSCLSGLKACYKVDTEADVVEVGTEFVQHLEPGLPTYNIVVASLQPGTNVSHALQMMRDIITCDESLFDPSPSCTGDDPPTLPHHMEVCV